MGTAAGIVATSASNIKTLIVPAWKGCTEAYFQQVLDRHKRPELSHWEIWPEYHFGGFGKFDDELLVSMEAFTAWHGVPLDPVYTGKMVYAVMARVNAGYFTSTDVVMMVHTGGLQGLDGYAYRFPGVWGGYVDRIRAKALRAPQ
jgi:1-aminocyclopropane-1-carboxylate deaminase